MLALSLVLAVAAVAPAPSDALDPGVVLAPTLSGGVTVIQMPDLSLEQAPTTSLQVPSDGFELPGLDELDGGTWTAPAAPTGQDELARLTERCGALLC